MNKFLSIIVAAVLFLTVAQNSFASGTSNCDAVYGGGQVCQNNVEFTINKLVKSPTKGGQFVENLTMNDAHYAAGSNVDFKISIKNTGDHDITNLNVVDTFPQFLTFFAGVGNTNKGASQINFMVGKIGKGATLEYVITAKAADASTLAQAINCVTNKVVATTPDGTTASDNSQVCIEKSVVAPTPAIMNKPEVKNIPSTGPETDILFGLVSTGALGYFIRRKIS